MIAVPPIAIVLVRRVLVKVPMMSLRRVNSTNAIIGSGSAILKTT